MKRHLTRQEEFDILKIVLDKFLLLAVFLLALGLYLVLTSENFLLSLSIIIAGVILMIIMTIILVREYEFIKS